MIGSIIKTLFLDQEKITAVKSGGYFFDHSG
jgi:hypothetical protein